MAYLSIQPLLFSCFPATRFFLLSYYYYNHKIPVTNIQQKLVIFSYLEWIEIIKCSMLHIVITIIIILNRNPIFKNLVIVLFTVFLVTVYMEFSSTMMNLSRLLPNYY